MNTNATLLPFGTERITVVLGRTLRDRVLEVAKLYMDDDLKVTRDHMIALLDLAADLRDPGPVTSGWLADQYEMAAMLLNSIRSDMGKDFDVASGELHNSTVVEGDDYYTGPMAV